MHKKKTPKQQKNKPEKLNPSLSDECCRAKAAFSCVRVMHNHAPLTLAQQRDSAVGTTISEPYSNSMCNRKIR